MKKEKLISQFDPNGVGLDNGNFIGLPFDEKLAEIVLLPVPWDVTVSFQEGTSTGPQNILDCSSQLDLMDPLVPDAWKIGLHVRQPDKMILKKNRQLRPIAKSYITFLERGGKIEDDETQKNNLNSLNNECNQLRKWVKKQTGKLLDKGKLVGLVGGDHSTPLGFLQTLSKRHKSFGVLQIDAHFDLRKAYEGFTYSHASIFYNALKINNLSSLVQVGIRDYCESEAAFAERQKKITAFYNHNIQAEKFGGKTWEEICEAIIAPLPKKVYISFDIDGLLPALCPNTGTPVPGGLSFDEALYLIQKVVESGRKIIGFDLCEVAGIGNDWDGNVGARIAYRLSNLMWFSNQKNKKQTR